MAGTRDPTEIENISVVLRFVNGSYEVTERLLMIATADKGDAQTLTDTVVAELNKAGVKDSQPGPVFTKNLKAKSSSQQGNLRTTPKNNGCVSCNFRTPNF